MEEGDEGGTLIFSRYISCADFWVSKFLNFNICIFFWRGGGCQKK